MELVGIDVSRIVYLTQVVRPAGQFYIPEAVAKLVQRYSFAKYPAIGELSKNTFSFGMGKFVDIQIDELGIYGDGLVASARVPSEKLDAFVSDLLSWTEKEFGLVQATTAKPEKFIESAIVVKASKDLSLALRPNTAAVDLLNKAFLSNASGHGPYKLSGFILDCDPTELAGRRKPMRFILERRIGLAYGQNVFYSHAPLHTNDHVKLLAQLEQISSA